MKAIKSNIKKNSHNSTISLKIFYIAFSVAFLFLVIMLGYRQIISYDYYKKRSQRQSMRRIIEPGARGDILDRNYKLIATNSPSFSAVVYFNDIRLEFREEYYRLKKNYLKARGSADFDWQECTKQARENVLNAYLAQINRILKTDYKITQSSFKRHFEERRLLPLALVKNLTPKQYAILAEKIPIDSNIQLQTQTSRYYPYGEAASHMLGFVGSKYNDLETDNMPGEELRTYYEQGKIGISGLEKTFDNDLKGHSGAKIWVVDLDGYNYENVTSLRPKKGKNLVSSIDIDLQVKIEEALGDRKGAAVALDIESGEILALVSSPRFDPNDPSDIAERGAWLNRATQGLYPPGSTFKLITAISALQNEIIDEDTVVDCQGGLKVGTRYFPCNNRNGHGNLTLEKAIEKSCNVYFYKVGLDLGIENLSNTAKEFGLDTKVDFELNENSSHKSVVATQKYKEKKGDGKWYVGDTANTSIGQGYLLQTPLQMACFCASFARGQTNTRVSVIHKAHRDTSMKYHQAKPIDIAKDKYDLIVEGMRNAVESGTAKATKIEGLDIAAKTGTAQVSVNSQKLTLAWIVAYAPISNPKFAISVVVEGEVAGDVGGGKTAGPIAKVAFLKYFENFLNKKVKN